MTQLSPNAAFVLMVLGLLGIYLEMVRPGGMVPGALGLGCTLAGGYLLWLRSPAAPGLELLTVASALFALEALINTWFLAGLAGTLAMASGFARLFDRPPALSPGLVWPLCGIFGGITIFLSYAAKRARRNKRERQAWNF